MKDHIVKEIGLRCACLEDGFQSVVVEDTCYKVQLASLNADKLCETSLAVSINSQESDQKDSDLIDYHKYSTSGTSKAYVHSLSSIVAEICSRFDLSLLLVSDSSSVSFIPGTNSYIPHTLPIICVVKVQDIYKVVYHEYLQLDSLHLYSLYSHHNFNVHSQMFNLLVHQIVQLYKCLASRSIFPLLSTHLISADKNFWLYVSLNSLLKAKNFCIITQDKTEKDQTMPSENATRLWELTEKWCQGKLTNLQYLLKLNEFAGRVRGDRHRHPILPWVVDFSSENAGFRRLDRTKYRLTKGDAQLNEQFSSPSDAYHVPEMLSDICYMAYRARREPTQELCKHVRSSWVPKEYPSTMARLFSWTPDECIPEFYEDPQLLKSLHEDMVDLGTPAWTSTPEEFIVWHRQKLESAEVSSKLHKWIDLAFGYLLSGTEAVKALNVQLSFVKCPPSARKVGTVKLFHKPHPRRLVFTTSETSNFLKTDAYFPLNGFQDVTANRQKDEDPSFDLQSIFRDIYKFHKFTEVGTEESLMSVGVTIIELALAEYCRDLSVDASFKDRLKRAQRLLTKSTKLPRNMRQALKVLLKAETFMQTTVKSSQLTNSFVSFFCIPASVVLAYELLAEFHSFDHPIATSLADLNALENYSTLLTLKMEQVQILWICFELTELSDLWLALYIEMLHCSKTASTVCQNLFGRAAQFCTRDVLVERLVPVMKTLFEGSVPNCVNLFNRRFILQLCIRFGTSTFFLHFLPSIVEAVLLTFDCIHEVARESILWLSKRFGPIVTATHITVNLLRLLAVCYTDSSQQLPEFDQVSLDVNVNGDMSCAFVTECLIQICAIYGPAFITLQYLPFCSDIIDQAMRRLTTPLESAVIAAVVTLKDICDCLSDKQIMDNLQDLIIDQILFPAVRLFSSANITFTSDRNRRLFAFKAIRTFHLIACRIGGENMQRHMSGLVQRIFCTFNLIYDLDESNERVVVAENAPKQLISTFTPSFAHLLLHIFSCICGKQFIANSLPNAELISKIAFRCSILNSISCSSDIPVKSAFLNCSSLRNMSPVAWASSPVLSSSPLSTSMQNGNRLSSFFVDGDFLSDSSQEISATSFDPSSHMTLNRKMGEDNCSHLTESWIDHFRSVLSSTSNKLAFNQLPLATFQGHFSAIRKIMVLDNENSFITSSQDKTIKLWSIKSTEKYSTCQWTYKNHLRPIQDFVLIAAGGLIASTADASIHLWDPFRGSAVFQLDWPANTNSNETEVVALAALNNHLFAAASNLESIVRTVDVRTGQFSQNICTSSISSATAVKSIAVSPSGNKLAVALNNGCNSIVDLRSGRILSHRALPHTDTIQVSWISEKCFASVHENHPAIIWTDCPKFRVERRLSEVASFLTPCSDSQFITYDSSHRLKICDSQHKCDIVKLRPEFVSGFLTSFVPLNLNKMFLAGSSTGMIRLAC